MMLIVRILDQSHDDSLVPMTELQEIIADRSWRILVGDEQLFPNAVVATAVQHCQYEWAVDARARGRTERLTAIDEVKEAGTNEWSDTWIVQAYTQGRLFGVSRLHAAVGLWCWDRLRQQWQLPKDRA